MVIQDIDPSDPSELCCVQKTTIKPWYIVGVLQMIGGVALNVLWAVVISNSSHYELSMKQSDPVLPYIYLLVPLIYVSSGILTVMAENTQNINVIVAFILVKFVSFLASLAFTIMHGANSFAFARMKAIFPADIASFVLTLFEFILSLCLYFAAGYSEETRNSPQMFSS